MAPVFFVNKEQDQLPRETGELGAEGPGESLKDCSEAPRGSQPEWGKGLWREEARIPVAAALCGWVQQPRSKPGGWRLHQEC